MTLHVYNGHTQLYTLRRREDYTARKSNPATERPNTFDNHTY